MESAARARETGECPPERTDVDLDFGPRAFSECDRNSTRSKMVSLLSVLSRSFECTSLGFDPSEKALGLCALEIEALCVVVVELECPRLYLLVCALHQVDPVA